MSDFNTICITGVAAAVTTLLGAPAPSDASAPPIGEVLHAAGAKWGGEPCDRVFLYNPDAIAQWIRREYRDYFTPLEQRIDLELPMRSVVPPVTPVCFASMYSGLTPERHGIRKYEKPVLTVPTVFDALPAAGKRVAIVSTEGDSISVIFLNRNVDYFIYKTKQECNAKALELIEADEYDMIVLYNGDYDHWMHRFTPKGRRALRALRENIATFCELHDAIEQHWQGHRTALAFAPDHGCHRALFPPGDHGVEKPCDMNITHFWSFI